MKHVLLPGMDGTGELFAPFISALPDSISPVVVSFSRTESASYDELVEIARRALPTDQPYAILGESFSGPIATRLAADANEQLRALIFSCSFVRNPSKALSILGKIVPIVPTHGVLPNAVRNLLLGVDSIKIRKIVSASMLTVSPDVIRSRLMQVLEVDVTEALRCVSVPVLYLRASNDRLVKPRCGDHIVSTNSNTRVVELGGPHHLLQTNPSECANTVSRFLKDIEGAL
jgi:pimeloyl-ACP methyl ester carboxylesterase